MQPRRSRCPARRAGLRRRHGTGAAAPEAPRGHAQNDESAPTDPQGGPGRPQRGRQGPGYGPAGARLATRRGPADSPGASTANEAGPGPGQLTGGERAHRSRAQRGEGGHAGGVWRAERDNPGIWRGGARAGGQRRRGDRTEPRSPQPHGAGRTDDTKETLRKSQYFAQGGALEIHRIFAQNADFCARLSAGPQPPREGRGTGTARSPKSFQRGPRGRGVGGYELATRRASLFVALVSMACRAFQRWPRWRNDTSSPSIDSSSRSVTPLFP